MSFMHILNAMKTSNHSDLDSLPKMLLLAGITNKGMNKMKMMEALNDFLSDEEKMLFVWNGLSEMEKELMTEYITSSKVIEKEEIEKIYLKYGQVYKSPYYGRRLMHFLPDESRALLFFVGGGMPEAFFKLLKKQIKPLEIRIEPLSNETVASLIEDLQGVVLAPGESFSEDLIQVIKLCNTQKLKATGASGLPTKTASVKINEVLTHKEPLFSESGIESVIRTVEQTIRIHGIAELMLEGGLLQVADTLFLPSYGVQTFLTETPTGRAKYLLNTYMKSKRIDELKRIPEIKVKTEYQGNYEKSREAVLKYVRHCPIGQWCKFEQMVYYMRKLDRHFLTECTGEVLPYDDYHSSYYSGGSTWDELEGRFVEIALTEYLTTLGIVEVIISESEDDSGTVYYRLELFKLTEFGAYVLGINEAYGEKLEIQQASNSDQGDMIVQPNGDIIIGQGVLQMSHQLFFDKFAEQVADDNVKIYHLAFTSIVRALDQSISVQQIIDYLDRYVKYPVPANIRTELEAWRNRSAKIRIRQVMVIETDDENLWLELKHTRSLHKYMPNQQTYLLEIDSSSAAKVKREIEKNRHFCNWV